MYKKAIELFLLDGNPNDRIICNISNWDGLCFKIPKTKVKESKDRQELQNTGVYILLNKDGDTGLAYIGEAENIYERLLQHVSKKEFFDTYNKLELYRYNIGEVGINNFKVEKNGENGYMGSYGYNAEKAYKLHPVILQTDINWSDLEAQLGL